MKRIIAAALFGVAILAAPSAEAGTALSHIGALKTEIEARLDALPDTLTGQDARDARRLTQALVNIDRDFPRCAHVLKGGTRAAKILEKAYRSEIQSRGTLHGILDEMCAGFEGQINEEYGDAETALSSETDPRARARAGKALDKATAFLALAQSAPTFSKRGKMLAKAFRFVEKAERFLN